MAITYVGVGTEDIVAGGDGSDLTPTLPAGLSAGDLLICAFYSRENTDGTVTISAGWTELVNSRGSGGLMAVWYRIYQSLDVDPTFVLTGHESGLSGDTAIVQIAAFRGVNTSHPIGEVGTVSDNAAAEDIGAIAGVTLTANSTIIVVGGRRDDWTSVADLSGESLTWVEISEPDSTGGADAGMVWDYAINGATSTDIAAKTFDVTGGSGAGKGVMFTIRAATENAGVTLLSSTGTFGTLENTTDGVDLPDIQDWVDPTNAASSNDTRATSTVTVLQGGTKVLRGTNVTWAPGLPNNLTIVGLEAIVECSDAGGGSRAYHALARLWYNSNWLGEDKALGPGDTYPAADADRTFGSSSDTWRVNLSRSILTDSGFGFGLLAGVDPTGDTVNPRVDFMRLIVYYTTSGPGLQPVGLAGAQDPNIPVGATLPGRWPYNHKAIDRKRRHVIGYRR